MDTWGTVREPARDTVGPFADCPTQLPESMTIMSTGDWNAGGERRACFLGYLRTQYGITDVDLVGHSNSGVWTRAAIKVLKDTNSPIRVRSLTTLSAPHTGVTPPRFYAGEIDIAACADNAPPVFAQAEIQWGITIIQEKCRIFPGRDTTGTIGRHSTRSDTFAFRKGCASL